MGIQFFPAAVAASQKLSVEVELKGNLLVGLYTDPKMTSTTVTFKGRPSAGDVYHSVGDGAGAAYTRTFIAGDYVPLDPATFSGIERIVAIFGSNETGAKNINFAART